MRVLASILSYNAEATLRDVVNGVECQTRAPDRILMVDNGSTDGTRAYLETLPSRFERHFLPENLGVGGGHNYALRKLMESEEFTHAWLLENDSIPPPDCLERLIESTTRLEDAGVRFGVVKPQQTHPSRPSPVREPGLRQAASTTFNGILIPKRTVAAVGLIREDFFIDQDDREYSRRLQAADLPIYVDLTLTIDHLGKGRGKTTRPTLVRTYYRVRNETFMRREAMPLPIALAETGARAVAAIGRTLLLEPDKRRRIIARLTAASDGLRGDLGRKDYAFLTNPASSSTDTDEASSAGAK